MGKSGRLGQDCSTQKNVESRCSKVEVEAEQNDDEVIDWPPNGNSSLHLEWLEVGWHSIRSSRNKICEYRLSGGFAEAGNGGKLRHETDGDGLSIVLISGNAWLERLDGVEFGRPNAVHELHLDLCAYGPVSHHTSHDKVEDAPRIHDLVCLVLRVPQSDRYETFWDRWPGPGGWVSMMTVANGGKCLTSRSTSNLASSLTTVGVAGSMKKRTVWR